MKRILTLCIIYQHPKILLGLKKRGFGKGRFNGFGGKVEKKESIEEAAKRETREEAGIDVTDLNKVGIIKFEFEDDSSLLEVHIFKSENFTGEPKESDEMKPKWFDVKEIPFDKMWSDDKFWMPMLLKGKKFRGRFLFDRPSDEDYTSNIIKKELIEVEKL